MTQTMTLVQAVRQIENGGTQIKIGDFDSFESFMDYFNVHYKPLLVRLADEWAMETDVRRFFTNDMLSAFSEEEQTDDGIIDPATACPADDPAQDVYATYSKDMRKAVAYINKQLEPEDKAIICAQVDKNFNHHMNPSYGIDDGKISDLLEEYGNDHDLPEGWWMEECDMDDIVLLINFVN